MRTTKIPSFSSMTTRQKVIAGALALVIFIVLWQIIGLFSGKGASRPTNAKIAQKGGMPANAPQLVTPRPAELAKPQPTSPRELALIKLQQDTEAKYIAALNELQMLKVAREIAETNQAIVTSKLAIVTAQKTIVGLLSGPTPQATSAAYAKGLIYQTSAAAPIAAPAAPAPAAAPVIQPQVNYSVISVSQLRYKWGAVLGYAGSLYNVSIGDVLPPDGSMVMSIDKSGVVLEKGGVRKKVSLVPII